MLPFGIQQTVETCLAAVQANHLHHLEYGYRLAMHAALGAANPHLAPATSVRPGSSAGFARRSYLRILSARFVLPYRVAQLPDDDTPQRILTACEQLIREAEAGFVSQERIRQYAQQYFHNDEDVFYHYLNQDHPPTPGVSDLLWQRSVLTGKVVKDVMGDICSDIYVLQYGVDHLEKYQCPVEADLSLTDEEYTDSENADSDIHCAVVYCAIVTPPWDDSTPERVRLIRERNSTFWHWWLTDAVAQAYASRPSP